MRMLALILAFTAACLPAFATTPAADAPYWRLRPYFQPQRTDSACSVASIAMAVNALGASVSPEALLKAVDGWAEKTGPGGEGVSFAELQLYLRRSLDSFGLGHARVQVFRPAGSDARSLDALRHVLAEAQDGVLLVTFDQGWLLGEASVGHVSPIGAYDAADARVLIMDVDPERPGPYWVRDEDLLAAMTRPDNDDPTGDGVIVVGR